LVPTEVLELLIFQIQLQNEVIGGRFFIGTTVLGLLFQEEKVKHLRGCLWVAAIVMQAAPGVSAQTASSHGATPSHSGTYSFVFGPAGTAIPAEPHAPFSAVLVEQMEQTLNDGTNIARDNQELVMRDGRGRIYHSRKIGRMRSSEREPWTLVTITDPVRHVQYLCTPLRKRCTKRGYRLPPSMRLPHAPSPDKGPGVTVEHLGSSNISGVAVEGTRVTRVIPEGMAGNDRPFATIEELWYSKELHIDVRVKRTDPRMGTRTTTMTEVSLGEPDPKYFHIPEGYRVEEQKSQHGALAPSSAVAEPLHPTVSVPPNK
jgi:hypothetical protein